MKKTISVFLLICLMIVCVLTGCQKEEAEAPTEEPTGGWTVNNEYAEAVMPEEAMDAFDKAMEGLDGANHTPVAYLGSQVVAGINYAYLCRTTLVTANPVTNLNVVVVYKNLEGNCSVLSVTSVAIADYNTGSNEQIKAEELAGGWTVYAADAATMPEDVQKAFDKATDSLMGMNYVPAAYLGGQNVAGMNYAILCRATTVTANPVTGLAVVIVYADLQGGATITSISNFSIA